MDSDMKWFVILIIGFIAVPGVGIGISEWHKQSCRVELAKAGRSVDEIRELCK